MLRFNRFIRSGYRAGLSPAQCCASILQRHNESGNIWSHLAPALLMLALAAGGQLQAWHGAAAAYWANLGSILLCFLGSVLYHTCLAHHHHHDRLLKLDVRPAWCGCDQHAGAAQAVARTKPPPRPLCCRPRCPWISAIAHSSGCKPAARRCAASYWCWWGAATW